MFPIWVNGAVMAIKGIIWDFSGVLLKPRVPDPHAFIAGELGVDPREFAKYLDGEGNRKLDLGEESEVEFYQRIISEQKLKEQDAMRIFNHYFFDLFELNQELIDYIRQSRARFKMGLCSNFSSLLRSLMTNKWKIIDLFDISVISSEVKLLKPDAPIFHLTLEKMALEPDEVVFVDDSEKNVISARALDIHSILFKDNSTTLQMLKQLAG